MKRFPMLNTFRFCAAMGVVLQHSEEIKFHAGLQNLYHYHSIKNLGGICVSAFFVLSGFLITYLLINEKNLHEQIDIKKFYRKRILRIWPLYFITLILYKGILPLIDLDKVSYIYTNSDFSFGQLIPLLEINSFTEWIFLLLLMPHVLLAIGKVFYPLHVWSIGVEETFYLFWPWVIQKSHQYRKVFFRILGIYLLLYIISFSIWIIFIHSGNESAKYLQASTFYLYCQRISCMAIGALGAEILINKRGHILQKVRHPYSQILVPTTLIFLLYKGIFFPVLMTEIYCALFICFILQIIQWGKNHQNNFFYKCTEKLGDISYGIYMYHPFCIILTLEIFSKIAIPFNNFYSFGIFYFCTCILTYGISWVSFTYIESPIQKWKKFKFLLF